MLSVSDTGWGVHSANEVRSREYHTHAREVARRDGWRCAGCGFELPAIAVETHKSGWESLGYFELQHRDGDHHNHDLANLELMCPFCHEPAHAGMRRRVPTGELIWFPWLGQGEINLLANVCAVSEERDGTYADAAHRLYAALKAYSGPAGALLEDEGSDVTHFAEGLLRLRQSYPKLYTRRGEAIRDLRYLPHYTTFRQAIRFWSQYAWPAESVWPVEYARWQQSPLPSLH